MIIYSQYFKIITALPEATISFCKIFDFCTNIRMVFIRSVHESSILLLTSNFTPESAIFDAFSISYT